MFKQAQLPACSPFAVSSQVQYCFPAQLFLTFLTNFFSITLVSFLKLPFRVLPFVQQRFINLHGPWRGSKTINIISNDDLVRPSVALIPFPRSISLFTLEMTECFLECIR